MTHDIPLRVSHLADAADHLGLTAIQGGSLPVWLGVRGTLAVGKAFTVRQRAVDSRSTSAPANPRHAEAVTTLAQAGDVLVISVEGTTGGATWGEAHTLRARNRGLAGVLIDGATRDIEGLRDRGFPLLCKGASPLRSVGRMETVEMAGAVQVNGARIEQGDTIAMDADGFVAIPPQHVEAVFERARQVAAAEAERDQRLAAGGV